MDGAGFPTTLEAITPQWLTSALRGCGALNGAEVRSFEATTLGVGVGFMSAMRRLQLAYDDPACGAPRTLIAKLPPADPGARQIDQAFNFYEKEVGFYQLIAPSTPIRAPKAYLSAYEPQSRDFVLLLEDLAPARVGDQLAGLTAAEAAMALRAVAGLHGRWWRDPALEPMDWLIAINSPEFKSLEPIYQQCWPAVVDFLGEAMSPQMRRIGERMATRVAAMLDKAAAQPRTILHGDYRADNLFFRDDGDADAIAVCDWQIAAQGGGAFDVAYLLTGSLDVDLRRAHEDDLLRGYHAELTRRGGVDYPFGDFLQDYRTCAMLAWCWPVVAIATLDPANERGLAMFHAWAGRGMAAIEDLGAADTLP